MLLSHCHVGPPGHFHRMWSEYQQDWGSPESLGRYVGELGYAKAVAFAPFAQWHDGDPNAWLLDAVKGDDRFIPWATINETGPAAEAMLRQHGPHGIRGIKFHPPIIKVAIDDPALEPFYALAEAWRLPILYHTGPHGWFLSKYRPMLVDEVAQRHPKLPLIIEHLGGEAFVGETFAVMQNNRNVYGGLATCVPKDAGWHVPTETIKKLIATFGAERFIFGADFPYNSVEANREALTTLRTMGLAAADVPLILSGNLERLNEGVSVR